MDDRHIEIEPYDEIVDRAEVYSTPSGSRSASPVSVDRNLPPAQSLSQGPSTYVYNANLMTSVMRPDPRYEIAVPHSQTCRAPRHVGGGSHKSRGNIGLESGENRGKQGKQKTGNRGLDQKKAGETED